LPWGSHDDYNDYQPGGENGSADLDRRRGES
jgi:hypothetical protein